MPSLGGGPTFRLGLRAALDAKGRVVAPAVWTVVGGRTVSLLAGDVVDRGDDVASARIDAVLAPGLVNAHAHHDLAGTPPLPAGETFPDWLMAVAGARASAVDVRVEAAREIESLSARGVVAAGDIDATSGEGTRARRAVGLSGRSYLEIVGVDPVTARRRLGRALARLDTLGGGREQLGLSPHAPYSVASAALPEIAASARARGVPLAMHLAETEEETRFVLHGDGPFATFLEKLGHGAPFDSAPGLRPIAYADRMGLMSADTLVIHGNDLDDADIALIAKRGASVVYCHGTHRHFARPAHRFLDLVEAGVTVALGTDSCASNDGVDLLGEMIRLVADRPDISPLRVLEAATSGGRRALGIEVGAATFVPGAAAEGVVLAAPSGDVEGRNGEALARWILSGQADVMFTCHRHAIVAPNAVPAAVSGFLDTIPRQG